MASQSGQAETLWEQAIKALDPSCVKNLDIARTAKRDVVAAVLKVAEAKHELSLKKRWRIKNSNGDEVIIRDVVEKIITWIRRFRDVGDIAVQYSPTYASLPWAAVRFLLQAAINETDVFGGLVDDLEMIIRLLARFREFEHLHLANGSRVDAQIRDALVRLYTRVLELLSGAISFFQESGAIRVLKSAFRSVDQHTRQQIRDWEAEILKLAGLADSERLLGIDTEVKRLAALSLDSRTSLDEAEYTSMLGWLSSVPFSSHHRDHSAARIPGTGEWLWHHPQYCDWMSSSLCSTFLLHGVPGAGKTLMFSAMVDRHLHHLSTTPDAVPLAYFYCSVSESEPERHHALGVLSSLTRQLTVKKSERAVHSAISAAYEHKKRVSKEENFPIARLNIQECIEVILEVLENNPVTIAIDAIDELEEPKELTVALSEILARSKNIVKVLLTSRDDSRIFALLPSATTLRITACHNLEDVKKFTQLAVDAAVKDHRLLLGDIKSELKEELVGALVSGAGEMFLWVRLQLVRLCQLRHESDLRNAVLHLNEMGIEELYQRTYDRILGAGDSAKQIATRTFAWLLYACDPLSPEVFLSVISTSTKFEVPQISSIVNICHNFIYLDSQLNVIRFSHQSVQEFLRSQSNLKPRLAQHILASNCVSVCSDGPSEDITKLEPTQRMYDYAALYWGHHCSAIEVTGQSHPLHTDLEAFLFDQGELGLFAAIWLDTIKATAGSLADDHPQRIAMETIIAADPSPLFPICAFGITSLLDQREWPDGFDWDQRNNAGQAPLYIASFFGHHCIVRHLITRGANVNIECGKYGSPLHCAAFRGHTQASTELLSGGADPNIGTSFETAIHAACMGNREDTALALLTAGLEIRDQYMFKSFLRAAAEAGFTRVIGELHKHRFSNLVTSSGRASLCVQAIAAGKLTSLKILLRSSQMENLLPEYAVAISAQSGHIEMTTFLLDQGYDIERPGDLGSPLRCASLMGHRAVCRLLLDRGADPNKASTFGTALHAAAMKGHTHTARLLIDSGAEINAQGGVFGTPVQGAAHYGHNEIIQLLLQTSPGHLQSEMCRNAIYAAVDGGQYAVLRWLLAWEERLDPTLPRYPLAFFHSFPSAYPPLPRYAPGFHHSFPTARVRRRSALEVESYHSPDSMTGMAELAGEFASEFADGESLGQTAGRDDDVHPLQVAAAQGQVEILTLLLSLKDRFQIDNSTIKRAIYTAAEKNQLQVLQTLCTHLGADVSWILEALRTAASNGHDAIVSSILEKAFTADHVKGYLRDFLTSGVISSSVSQLVLRRIEVEMDRQEFTKQLLSHVVMCASYGQVETVEWIIERYSQIRQQDLALIFRVACSHGRCSVARYVYPHLTRGPAHWDKVLTYAKAALMACHVELFEWLLTLMDKRDVQPCLHVMIFWAAGNGLCSTLAMLLDHTTHDQVPVLTRALNISAEKGQLESCRLLLGRSADPTAHIEPVNTEDLLVLTTDGLDSSESDASATDGLNSVGFDCVRAFRSRKISRRIPSSQCRSPSTYALKSCITGLRLSYSRDQVAGRLTGVLPRKRKADSSHSQIETLELIISYGSKIHQSDLDECLGLAVSMGASKAVSLLLQHSAVTFSKSIGSSDLETLLNQPHPDFEVARLLVDAGFTEGKEEHFFHILSPKLLGQFLLQICDQSGHRDRIDAFCRRTSQGSRVQSESSLKQYFTSGTGYVVLHLLEHMPDKSLKSIDQQALIPIAVAAESGELVQRILNSGSAVDAAEPSLGTGLQVAAYCGNLELLRYLLGRNADPNANVENRRTPLTEAVLNDHKEAVVLLLDHGAAVNAPAHLAIRSTSSSVTIFPIQLALYICGWDIVKLLCDRGADPYIHVRARLPLTGFPPDLNWSILAEACHTPDVDRLLIESMLKTWSRPAFLDREERQIIMRDALLAAIDRDRVDLVNMLLGRGFTPVLDSLSFTTQRGKLQILRRLLEEAPILSSQDMVYLLNTAISHCQPEAIATISMYGTGDLDRLLACELIDHAYSGGHAAVLEAVLELVSRHHDLASISMELRCWKANLYIANEKTHREILLDYMELPTSLSLEPSALLVDTMPTYGTAWYSIPPSFSKSRRA